MLVRPGLYLLVVFVLSSSFAPHLLHRQNQARGKPDSQRSLASRGVTVPLLLVALQLIFVL
jgi:hypothetical protein